MSNVKYEINKLIVNINYRNYVQTKLSEIETYDIIIQECRISVIIPRNQRVRKFYSKASYKVQKWDYKPPRDA